MNIIVINTARIVCGAGSLKRSRVRPSVCLSRRSIAAAEWGGFAAESPEGRRFRSITGAGAQQQRRRSTALSSKCGQCCWWQPTNEAERILIKITTGYELFCCVRQNSKCCIFTVIRVSCITLLTSSSRSEISIFGYRHLLLTVSTTVTA